MGPRSLLVEVEIEQKYECTKYSVLMLSQCLMLVKIRNPILATANHYQLSRAYKNCICSIVLRVTQAIIACAVCGLVHLVEKQQIVQQFKTR